MTPEELLDAVKQIADALRTDLSGSIDAIGKRCDALAEDVKANKKDAKKDEAGERDRGVDGTMAERVAADSVDPAVFASLARSVAELKKNQSRPMNANALADLQAKADAVMRTHNERAAPPMASEDEISYAIRLHRGMQKFSPKWKGIDLGIISADGKAFQNVLAEIRSDALQAGLNPVDLPEFEHRLITETAPGGHTINRWVGTGTIFKQLSRPVRHVQRFGPRWEGAGR
jgi:hypothetical protein